MSNVITIQVPAPRPTPRGALLVGHLFDLLLCATSRLRRASTARELTPEESAETLRVYARSIRHSQPGFASDLFAAANRHELIEKA